MQGSLSSEEQHTINRMDVYEQTKERMECAGGIKMDTHH